MGMLPRTPRYNAHLPGPHHRPATCTPPRPPLPPPCPAGVLNVAGAMYAGCIFIGVIFCFQVQDPVGLRR